MYSFPGLLLGAKISSQEDLLLSRASRQKGKKEEEGEKKAKGGEGWVCYPLRRMIRAGTASGLEGTRMSKSLPLHIRVGLSVYGHHAEGHT